MVDVEAVNQLSEEQAYELFLKCSGSKVWSRIMTDERPFAGCRQLKARADEVWNRMEPQDWVSAFASHPRIGDLEGLRQKFAGTANLAEEEQFGVTTASEETLRGLIEGNKRYLEKFGYLFIVCATGKTASEMLSGLNERLGNQPEIEFGLAQSEQKSITLMRLEKLLP